MSQKYIVSTAFGTYFHQVLLYTTCHGRVGTWAILGQVNLLQNKSDRSQNWQGDTKSIVEYNDLLFIKVWGGDVFMGTIKVEKYFFLHVGLLLVSQVSVS